MASYVDLDRLQRRQDGVVARRQVLALGGDDALVARRLRRRQWARVHEGVYVDHTGPLTRRQRAWAAVLVHRGSALAASSALEAFGLGVAGTRRRDSPVELVVPRSFRVDDPPGTRSSQLRRFDELVDLHLAPPRMRLEPAALLAASRERTDDAAVGVLAEVVRAGRTTVERLAADLDLLTRLPGRKLLREVLADVSAGVESPLERRYLRDVERAHRLPRGRRQVVESIEVVEGEPFRVVRRDVRYPAHATIVELDGALGHAATIDRWADLDRDLEAATHGTLTLRAGWRQVLHPCRLAVLVGAVLATRGWAGAPVPCPSQDCAARPARIALTW